MLVEYVKATKVWMDAHPDSEAVKRFGNAYNITYANIFSKSVKDYEDRINIPIVPPDCEDPEGWRERYFGTRDWRKDSGAKLNTKLFLEDYFGIKFEE